MHNFPKDIQVICTKKHTLAEAKEIFHLCIDNNVNIYYKTLKEPVDKEYPYFVFEDDEIAQSWATKKEDPQHFYVSLEEFKAFIQGKGKYTFPFKETVELNSDYSAVITKNSIKVGYQEFSHDKIKELYLLSQKALKS
jgi:hypothetical protein